MTEDWRNDPAVAARVAEQKKRLLRGAVNVISEAELENRLAASIRGRKPLRVKLGVDPTSAQLHLGFTVVLNKLRAFQDCGHTAVLIVGDATALVGDPTGRNQTRPGSLRPRSTRTRRRTSSRPGWCSTFPGSRSAGTPSGSGSSGSTG